MQVPQTDPDRPVLIAGPTASGKSALAAEIAVRQGGVIVNADAAQVFDCWRLLTARPSAAEEACLPHRLYGHVRAAERYSVGDWLRDLAPLLDAAARPIVVGGTGLYFSALTGGLAGIPPIPPEIRADATRQVEDRGARALAQTLDDRTRMRIDTANPARVRRAWEVLRATGHGLAEWQDATPAPLLPLTKTQPFLLVPEREWLADRIAHRFDAMLAEGALEEVRAAWSCIADGWPAAKALGAADLAAHLAGSVPLATAREAAITATRRYAKRQRTWFRSRMAAWHPIELP